MQPVRPADHLANERTFLAYVRTALSLMGFGFVISRFDLFLRLLPAAAAPAALRDPTGERLGIAFAAFGTAIAIVGVVRYVAAAAAIDRGEFKPARTIAIVTGVATFLLGLAVTARLLRLL